MLENNYEKQIANCVNGVVRYEKAKLYVEEHKGTTTAKTRKEIFEANQSLIRENLFIVMMMVK